MQIRAWMHDNLEQTSDSIVWQCLGHTLFAGVVLLCLGLIMLGFLGKY